MVCCWMIIDRFITFTWVRVDNDFQHGWKFMKEGMTDLFCDEMPLQNG